MKHILPRLLMALCALMLSVSSLWADRVSQEDAALVAANFFNAPDTTQGDTSAANAPKRNRPMRRVPLAAEAQYYIYANADGEGWVMVAANDVVKPILAYSDEGEFLADNMPSNVTHWLGHYDKFIKKLEDEGVTQTEEAAAQWRALRKAPPSTAKGNIVVDVLVQTQWDQGAPYNNLCPGSGNTKAYTGCVATAMAQVMNFWQWPVTGNGSRTYQPKDPTSDSGGTSKRYGQQTANFGSTTYDWANMKKKHSSSDNTTQKTAISTLMYHCGVATDMMYGNDADGGSATYTVNYGDWDWLDSEGECAQNALYNFFRYKKPTGYMRDGYSYGGRQYYKSWSDDDWTAMVKAELDEGRPIMYGGSGSGGGHSFICDGYDDQDYFHFNWGWSGSNDGWYTLSNLVPGSGGAGGGSYSFSDGQDVIIGIEPVETGHKVVLNGTGCTLSAKQRVENSQSLTVTITPTDATYDYSSTMVKLGSTTLTETTHYTLSSDKKTLTIKAAAITGDASNDLTITVVWTKNRYKYEMLGESCTEELSGTLEKNAALNLTITPAKGYTLANADCWVVTMGGNTLTYNSGFTYNANTGAFSIASVTGDVEIYAFGGHQVTWYANGSLYTTNMSISDKITLPGNPADCSGTNGKKFVGWCTSSDYSSATTAPTFAKDEDEYSVATYYAVYATPVGSGEPRRATASAKATSIAVGDEVILVCETNTVELSGFTTSGTIYGQGTSYTGTPAGTYSFSVVAGSANNSYAFVRDGKYWNWSSGNSLSTATSVSENSSWNVTISDGNATITNVKDNTRKIRWNNGNPRFACYTSGQTDVQLYKISGGSGDGGSYTDYSTTCTTCTNTPTMSFSPATVDKTTADGSFTKEVSISGKGSGQTVAYSSSDESIATVTNSGVVTLKGVVGSTTITASVEADGDYCAASAYYTLNVTAAPIDVTLHYNGGTATLNNQTPPYTLPTTSAYTVAMCDGDWTFAGWYGSEYAKSTTAPTYITQLNATGSAYAVYTMTETISSAPARAKAAESGAVTITTSTTNIPTGYGDANKFTEYTFEGYKFKVQQMYLNGGKLQWRAEGNNNGTGTMYNAQTFPGKITSIVLTYNSSDANKNFTVKVGSSENPTSGTSITPTANELVYTFDCSSANADYFVLTNGSGAGYLDQIVINYGGSTPTSTTYYATTPECVTPCSHEPVMSFASATVNKTTDDKSYTQAVTIDGKGSGQTVTYSSSDETVATVTNFGAVTLKGVVGSTTITASVAADGDYCAASASYTLNVTAAPIDVTLYYNSTSASLTSQTNPYTLPTGAPYNTAMCDDAWTFAGWYGSEYAKSTDQPNYITQLTSTGSAYAVYTTTETSGSGGSVGSKTFTFSSIASANNWSNGTAYTSVEISPVTLSAVGGGNNGKYYTSDQTWRMYNEGTVNISVEGGSVTSVTSKPSETFTISEGVATLSCTETIKFTEITVEYSVGGGSSTTYYATTPVCDAPPATTYTVTWVACGDVIQTDTFNEGAALVLPDTPGANAGKSFAGWTSKEHHTGTSAPDDMFKTAGSKTVTADATYYAVYE